MAARSNVRSAFLHGAINLRWQKKSMPMHNLVVACVVRDVYRHGLILLHPQKRTGNPSVICNCSDKAVR